ncbi:MAG: class I SAM-dependent methyltransferase [Flavobacteriales bacterium]|nr:class I SAM-dependent methyltransferase [Flavobacteriales bacterium]
MMNKKIQKFWWMLNGGADVARTHAATTLGPTESERTPEEWLANMDDPFRAALLSMYNGLPQKGSDGAVHKINDTARISPEQGTWMYEVTLALKPTSILEVGMAYGFSSLYFLAALKRNGSGTLTSIDPFQHNPYTGVGVTHALTHAPKDASGTSFNLVEDRSDRAIVDLLRSGRRYDLIYIDGNHRFDDVLVDFYLCDQVCGLGGHIILDDMWMSSIKSVAEFIRMNRDHFVEVKSPVWNTAMFKKVKKDDRSWNHFKTFSVSPSA